MEASIKDGFYVDPDTKKTFHVTKGMVPHWVKSKPSDWKSLNKKEEQKKEFNSHDFEDVYKELGINVDKLGCIMLDLSPVGLPQFPGEENDLYYSKSRFWIKGYVAAKTPHVTLLYGLLKPGLEWKKQVDAVLKGWSIKSVKIKKIDYFESNIKEEPYYCIVAHVDITPNLLEGHQRLELLPHINTFPDYKAHFTLAYIKKDEIKRNLIIHLLKNQLEGKELKVTKLNYGGNKDE